MDLNDLGIRILKQNNPQARSIPLVSNTIRGLPLHIKQVIPPLTIIIRDVLSYKYLKSDTIGYWINNTNEIHLATNYYLNGKKYNIPKKQLVNALLHEIGHSVDYLNNQPLSTDLLPCIKNDIKKLSYLEKNRCAYFIYDESEMFAETFAYLAGSQYSIALSSKEFKHQFPNTIMEVKLRLNNFSKLLHDMVNNEFY